MKKSKKILIAIIFITIGGLVTASVYLVNKKNNEHAEVQLLPKLSFETLSGETIELDVPIGKGLIISFVNTNCMYCNAELSTFKKNYKKVSEKFDVYFVSTEKLEKVKKHFDEYKIEDYPAYNVLLDKNYEIDKSFKVKHVPTLFVYNKKGELLKVLKGLSKIEKITAMVD